MVSQNRARESIEIAEADPERSKLQAKAEWAAIERVVQTYKEAIALVQQKNYMEAKTKYREVIREGARIGDPMVLKLVSAALRLLAQCQFHLWQSVEQAKSEERERQVRKTDEYGERWKNLLAEKERLSDDHKH